MAKITYKDAVLKLRRLYIKFKKDFSRLAVKQRHSFIKTLESADRAKAAMIRRKIKT